LVRCKIAVIVSSYNIIKIEDTCSKRAFRLQRYIFNDKGNREILSHVHNVTRDLDNIQWRYD
jgi:hypothetical protein